MKVNALRTSKAIEVVNVNQYGIQSYGEKNDFPQKVEEIVSASVTGFACVDTFAKFIYGRGFTIADFGSAKANAKGDTFDDILVKISTDYARFGGFALHLNYNALGKVVSIAHMPFECLRLGIENEEGRVTKVAYHPDWGKRDYKRKRFSSDDIEWFYLFNPDIEEIRVEVELSLGWENYKGQVFYFSSMGKGVYPLPIFTPALTDMSTEEGLSNISLRNARNNFLSAGMFIDFNNSANSDEQQEETRRELKEFQGDTNVGKILYFNIENGDKVPQFVPFSGENRDMSFRNTEQVIPERIGSAFRQPAVLRGRESANGFDTQRIRQAYKFYNSITQGERNAVSRCFSMICALWKYTINAEEDYSILPSRYDVEETLGDRLGANIDKVLQLIDNETIAEDKKRVLLREIYGIDDDIIDKLI